MNDRFTIVPLCLLLATSAGCFEAKHQGPATSAVEDRPQHVSTARWVAPTDQPDAPRATPASSILLVSFSTPLLHDLTARHLEAMSRSSYTGIAVALRGPSDTGHQSEKGLDSAIANVKAHTGKRIWPWIFVNRVIGIPDEGAGSDRLPAAKSGHGHIPGLDLWNDTGALDDFYADWNLALQTARKLGSPGIVIDHEAYDNYQSYNVSYVARKSGRSERDVVARLEAIGAHLSDLTDAEYPNAVLWFLSSGLISADESGPYPQRAGSYIALGMLERAKATRAAWTLVAGGEQSLGYCFLSLADLQATSGEREKKFERLLATYPQLTLGGTIAPWTDASKRSGWMLDGRCGRSRLNTADDFVPLFRELLQRYRYVWIYAAKVAPYDPYDSLAASAYDHALRAAIP